MRYCTSRERRPIARAFRCGRTSSLGPQASSLRPGLKPGHVVASIVSSAFRARCQYHFRHWRGRFQGNRRRVESRKSKVESVQKRAERPWGLFLPSLDFRLSTFDSSFSQVGGGAAPIKRVVRRKLSLLERLESSSELTSSNMGDTFARFGVGEVIPP